MAKIPFSGASAVVPAEVVDDGAYDLTITKILGGSEGEPKTTKAGIPKITCIIKIDNAEAPAIFHDIIMPEDGDENDWNVRFGKAFLDLFGIEVDEAGFDDEDLENATASNVPVVKECGDDGVWRNKIKLSV